MGAQTGDLGRSLLLLGGIQRDVLSGCRDEVSEMSRVGWTMSWWDLLVCPTSSWVTGEGVAMYTDILMLQFPHLCVYSCLRLRERDIDY